MAPPRALLLHLRAARAPAERRRHAGLLENLAPTLTLAPTPTLTLAAALTLAPTLTLTLAAAPPYPYPSPGTPAGAWCKLAVPEDATVSQFGDHFLISLRSAWQGHAAGALLAKNPNPNPKS